MAKKGETKGEKRLATSTVRNIKRKEKKWTIRAKPGKHTRKTSVPLGIVLRELIGITQNARETRNVLQLGKVLIDGKKVKDQRQPIGLFDIISLEGQKENYRMHYDKKGRLFTEKEKAEKTQTKIIRVKSKKIVKGKKISLSTNDSRTIITDNKDISVGDSLKITVPEQKIVSHIKMESGKKVLVTGGKHIGETAKIKEVKEGTIRIPKGIVLKGEEGVYQTVAKNIFLIE